MRVALKLPDLAALLAQARAAQSSVVMQIFPCNTCKWRMYIETLKSKLLRVVSPVPGIAIVWVNCACTCWHLHIYKHAYETRVPSRVHSSLITLASETSAELIKKAVYTSFPGKTSSVWAHNGRSGTGLSPSLS